MKAAYAIHHLFEWDLFHQLVFAIDSLYLEYVIAEVERLEATLLTKKSNHYTSRPIEPFSKELFDSKLVFAHRDAIDELESRPQSIAHNDKTRVKRS